VAAICARGVAIDGGRRRWTALGWGRGSMTCRSSRRLGLVNLPRDLPFEGLIYARPNVTLAPVFFAAAACQSETVRL
jgi:hypothetical protein